jgi:putative mRNA 3-end processing factor
MLTMTGEGLWCAAGDFHVDPCRRVDRALITHAHSDHARPGSRAYLCAREGMDVLRLRIGGKAPVTGLRQGETVNLNGVTVSFHPAGHVLGSAQIRLEHRGEVWVVSGDYKRQADPTCAGFEPVRCHTFVTESTFGLPVYRWPEPEQVFAEIRAWWLGNQQQDLTSVLFGYSLGKAQRLLAGVGTSLGPVFVHEAVREFLPVYEAAGIELPPVETATPANVRAARGKSLVIAPPVTGDSPWLQGLGEVSVAFASGWMLIRAMRRRRSGGRGFALSDHADWPDLIRTIRETEATRVLVTHGTAGPLVRWLNENGWQAEALPTRFVRSPESSAMPG